MASEGAMVASEGAMVMEWIMQTGWKLAVCFLLGSIPFAVIAMWGTGIDVTRQGSGNPGFNNVLRFNKSRAVLTLLGDLGKGVLAAWLFFAPTQDYNLGWMCAFAVTLGHCYSPFLKFHGGKGIATSAGALLVLYPLWGAMAIVVYAVLRITGSKRKWPEAGAIASLSTWAIFALGMLLFLGPDPAWKALLMMLLVAWRHKKNFLILAGRAPAH